MSYENKGTIYPRFIVADDGTGNYNCNATSDQDEINQALTDMISIWGGGTVALKGSFTIDDTIVMPGYATLDATQASITLADDSNCDMVENEHVAHLNADLDQHITILGGIWSGGTQSGGTSRCFNFEGILDHNVDFLNFGGKIQIVSIQDDAVHLNWVLQSSQWGTIDVGNVGGEGFKLERFWDCWWSGALNPSTVNGVGLEISNSGSSFINQVYAGGAQHGSAHSCQVYLDAIRLCINAMRVDYVREHAIIIDGPDADEGSFNYIGCLRISQVVDDDNTWDALRFEGNASHNIIPALIINTEDANDWRYAVNFSTANNDYNRVAGYVEQYQTGKVNDAGTGNDVSDLLG